jgi:hypothetical protein
MSRPGGALKSQRKGPTVFAGPWFPTAAHPRASMIPKDCERFAGVSLANAGGFADGPVVAVFKDRSEIAEQCIGYLISKGLAFDRCL